MDLTGIGGLAKLGESLLERFVPKKADPETQQAMENAFLLALQGGVNDIVKSAAEVIKAEINSDSWLAKNWRPALMSLFGIIIANNYIIAPYVSLFFGADKAVSLEIPPDMWQLLKIGLGGYVVGRSAEKCFDQYKKKKD